MGGRAVTAVSDLVERAEALGATFTLTSDSVKVNAPRPLPPDLMAELREHKAEIIGHLRQGALPIDRRSPGQQADRPTLNRFGIGHHTMVTETFIANLRIDRNPAPLPDAEFDNDRDLFHRLEQKHNQLLGLGWWLIFNGELLEPAARPQ